MADDLFDFQWTKWEDDVGDVFKKAIEDDLVDLENVGEKLSATLKQTDTVLSRRETYLSQRSRIIELEVRE